MRASSTQKAYDEAFLACSTAVYFESKSNEQEALRSWRTALDHITYHNAHRGPSLARPSSSSTERALVESLRQLELQCKERVDLLETLKKSREENSTPVDANTPVLHPQPTPVAQSESNGSPGWLGGGTIPPVDYSHLSRPPPLPKRPSLAPRKSTGTESTRSLAQIPSTSSLMAPGQASAKGSRTPSPEKKGRMLRTLRPGRDTKSSSSTKLPASMRPQPPDAAKAATLAFNFKANSGPSRLAKTPSAPMQTASSRPSLDIPSSSLDAAAMSPAAQVTDSNPFQSAYSRSTDTLNAPSQSQSTGSAGIGVDLDQASKAPRLTRKSIPTSSSPKTSLDTGRSKSYQANVSVPSMPTYRNEYPESAAASRALTASAAAKLSWPDNASSSTPSTSNTTQSYSRATDNRARRLKKESPESIPIDAGDNETKVRPPARRKGKPRGNTARADLPPTPSSDVSDSDASESDSDEWKEKCRLILKNLPRGVDEAAAKQILNEIVIQGDEVHWDDVAGLDVAKSALKETVVYPFLRPDLFMGLREPARGMLLFGPPGTGKTMLARAVATESHSTFFAISASSLTSKFLGESEKLVRALFALAKMLAPSIIFIDEIDSLLSSRSGSGEHEATRRIKTEFLIQWSDLAKAAAGKEQTDKDRERGDASRVLVLAATNLPWAIDEAARRRFVRRQYIPLPEPHVRKSQVQTLLSHQKHELDEADLDHLVSLTDGKFHFPVSFWPLVH